jgi:putative PIN family toxin of toxin-antitoxin system
VSPRVVADTNVFLSALVFGGPPEEIIDLARRGQIELLVSSQILLELANVLKSKFEWRDADVADAIRTIGYCSTLVKPGVVITAAKDDPDNRVLECAVACEADFIVSGDHHLLELESYRGIRILKARGLLDLLET